FQTAASEPSGTPSAICKFRSLGEDWTCFVNAGDEPVHLRKPYDEGPASKYATITGRRAIIDSKMAMRPIETVTALAVVLHKHVLFPGTGERWMLARLTLERPLQERDAGRAELEIDRIIARGMTRTVLKDDAGIQIGTMLFILSHG
ncbi:MAG: hypothetical protein ACRETL_16385, partial [Gammaproteobacteria bacterium]